MKKDREYYFVDINLATMQVVNWGVSSTANHTGETDDPDVHRIFLTKGQYNKFARHLE